MKKPIILAGMVGFIAGIVTGVVSVKLAKVVVEKVGNKLNDIDLLAEVDRCEGCECEMDCAQCSLHDEELGCACSAFCLAPKEKTNTEE